MMAMFTAQTQSVWIDERGKVWDTNSRSVRISLDLELVDGDVVPVLIEKLGFVVVSVRSGRAVVRFDPAVVSKSTFVALYCWLAAAPVMSRVGLVFVDAASERRFEIFACPREALLRMEALLAWDQEQNWSSLFTMHAGSLSTLAHHSKLGPLLEHWKTTGGAYTAGTYAPLLARSANGRYIAFEPQQDGRLSISAAGSGLQIPDKNALRTLAGSRLESVPDQEYAAWTGKVYKGVLGSQQPRYDHIRAYIKWPSSGRVERKYSRLVLPCRTIDGGHMLLGISCALAEPDLLAKAI